MQTASDGASAKAQDYMLKRWTSLGRYAYTSHLPIDNNPGESVICPSHEIERRTIMSGYAMENGDKLWPAFPNPLPL